MNKSLMMNAPNSLVRQKEGDSGERSKKGRTDRNSDTRRGRSHRSNSVKAVGCETQEKTWTVVWGINPQEGQRGARDQSYPLTIEMQEATERRSKL